MPEFEELLTQAGVELRLVAPLAYYGAAVLAANRRFNVTGAKTASEFSEHILDSLTVVPLIGSSLVDVGSGAGVPALPIAIAAGVPVTLIESNRRKAQFLEGLLADLKLRGQVVAERAETAAHRGELREAFDSGTVRAVADAPVVAELLLPFIAPGGVAVLQRGALPSGERTALADAVLVLGAQVEREIPLGRQRRILLLRKHTRTPARFPRRTGVPEKRPLCS